ncbi:glycosyltransferase family 2 protein [Falsiroseomonas sp. HW251]|uniref:glycosyltransferase family 2 protein n=1 Tax=Falsiroseomonas sp. HW251 TaxID=3390998 RepID=UPI003D311F51
MKLSIVSTLYRSAPGLREFHRRAMQAAEAVADEVEMVLVDDGSPDESLDLALEIQRGDPRVVVVELSRNFGHHRAMMTGLAQSSGELVFLLDSDLEEEPEILGAFHATMQQGGWDVVYGVQAERRGGLVDRVAGAAFYALVGALSDSKLPRNLVTARLMRRPYVDALVTHQDRSFQISELWLATGFRQTAMEVRKLSLSPTTYSFRRRLEMAVQQVTTTSTRLLHVIFHFGLLVFALSLAAMGFFLMRWLVHGIGVEGWLSVILSVWFFGGTIVMILGVLGLYIANILQETKRRPYTVIRAVHRAGAAP